MEEETTKKTLIVGNWKCHCDLPYVKEIINNMLNKLTFNPEVIDVMIAPPLIHIPSAKALLTAPIGIVAQNVSAYPKGSYTGEVNAESLKDFGVEWIIVGHSERRDLFQDTEERVAMKAEEVHKQGLNVLLCIPDRLDERDPAKAWQAIEKQLALFKGRLMFRLTLNIEKKIDWKKTVLVYEPVAGTGTNRTITIEHVEEVCGQIRKWVHENTAPEVGDSVRVIYAGPITETNCKLYVTQKNVDGFLV